MICVGIMAALWQSNRSGRGVATNTDILAKIYQEPAPNFDLNANAVACRCSQSRPVNSLQLWRILKPRSNAPNMTVRWNDFGGSPDVMYDFAIAAVLGHAGASGTSFHHPERVACSA